jgi:hypothetical protein
MKQVSPILAFTLLAAGACLGQKVPPEQPQPPNQMEIDRLQAEIPKASQAHQAKLYAELADYLVDVANQQFEHAESVAGHATIQEIDQDAVKARDLAISTKRYRKEVEMLFRKLQRHLEAVKHTLAAEDRPPVDAVEKKLADMREELLESMFEPNHKKVEAK